MYFAGKLVYLIVLLSDQLAISKHKIICGYVSTNCHKCAECANTKKLKNL